MTDAIIYHQKEKWVLRWNTREGKHSVEHKEGFDTENEAKEEAAARDLKVKERPVKNFGFLPAGSSRLDKTF